MSEKQKSPLAEAQRVAAQLAGVLEPFCERIIVAGSIRRRKPLVGDIEIVYVPRVIEVPNPDSLLGELIPLNQADAQLGVLLLGGIIERRLNVNGSATWGAENKLARDLRTGIGVDFFATREECWWNYLVFRTGSGESNIRIATAAKERGWKWLVTGEGFERRSGPDRGRIVTMGSERAVFEFVKLPFLPPEKRE